MSKNSKGKKVGLGGTILVALGISAYFLAAAERTFVYEGKEGDCVEHRHDLGGRTNGFGITHKLAAKYGYSDPCKMTKEQSLGVAESEFWTPYMLDSVATVNEQIAYDIFDFGYNSGRSRTAIRWVQYAIGADADGFIGPQTLGLLRQSNPDSVFQMLNDAQARYYLRITEQRHGGKNESFFAGWMTHRVQGPKGTLVVDEEEPVRVLQRCLNAANRQQRDYNDVRLTGRYDRPTMEALTALVKKRWSRRQGDIGRLIMYRCQRAHL